MNRKRTDPAVLARRRSGHAKQRLAEQAAKPPADYVREPGTKRIGLSDRLRLAIRASGLPVAQIAEHAGVGVKPLQRFARGDVGLSLATAERVASVLGCNLFWDDLGPSVEFRSAVPVVETALG